MALIKAFSLFTLSTRVRGTSDHRPTPPQSAGTAMACLSWRPHLHSEPLNPSPPDPLSRWSESCLARLRVVGIRSELARVAPPKHAIALTAWASSRRCQLNDKTATAYRS
ncbi:hypothetical protein A9K55_006825 [Cordyceps militaris]|uniref:Secreted protein n=1 Tax=Cordyceps militaris TaxID=73501 RepID=A0A2H4SDG1_CORMI|nr:hypothetical protein A9K55_006825 [Cordyceps militaris]